MPPARSIRRRTSAHPRWPFITMLPHILWLELLLSVSWDFRHVGSDGLYYCRQCLVFYFMLSLEVCVVDINALCLFCCFLDRLICFPQYRAIVFLLSQMVITVVLDALCLLPNFSDGLDFCLVCVHLDGPLDLVGLSHAPVPCAVKLVRS
jgi:hypothetical protein